MKPLYVGALESQGGYEGGHLHLFLGATSSEVLSQIWHHLTDQDHCQEFAIYGKSLGYQEFLATPGGYSEAGDIRWQVHPMESGDSKTFFPNC